MKTKTTPAHIEPWVCSFVRSMKYIQPDGSVQDDYGSSRWERRTDINYEANTIAYDIGPKYLNVPRRHCNWKRCFHTGSIRQFEGCAYNCSSESRPILGVSGMELVTNVYGMNPFTVSYPVSFPSMPPMPDLDISDLASRMYSDLVGRVNESFLSLESLAGIFSGNSLFKTIGGVANATSSFAKAISDLKRLQKAFGHKASLYNMWLSSRELVRQIMGFDLGYRFAFKATLSDISSVVDAVCGLQQDINRLSLRNDGQLHVYTKDAQKTESNDVRISGNDFVNAFRYASPATPNPISSIPANAAPDAVLRSRSTAKARLFTWATVSYPREYITKTRILQSRFGLDKPLSTMWAIVPCSFVVDYLIRVQDFLGTLDNQLNEYSVAVDISDAWLVMSTKSVNEILWPGYSSRSSGMGETFSISCPPLHATRVTGEYFSRTPFASTSIMSELGSLFRTDSEAWTTRVGTGLELLLTRRLR